MRATIYLSDKYGTLILLPVLVNEFISSSQEFKYYWNKNIINYNLGHTFVVCFFNKLFE